MHGRLLAAIAGKAVDLDHGIGEFHARLVLDRVDADGDDARVGEHGHTISTHSAAAVRSRRKCQRTRPTTTTARDDDRGAAPELVRDLLVARPGEIAG